VHERIAKILSIPVRGSAHTLKPNLSARRYVFRLQEERFRKLIQHAARVSPYYERKFAGIKLETCVLAELPILTKREMMQNFEDVITDRTVRREDVQKFVEDPSNLGKLFKGK
jgi:phenylacetate-CoA ligase